MEKEEFRNNEHLEANEELHDRYYYITDQLHEHDDEHMLQLNIRRGIEVPVHGSREDGPNEHWNVSRFTGQWLLTHNGRAHVTKAFREHWLAGRKRWQVILAIIGTLLGIIGVLWPGFREYLFSFFKN
jgi:hypothetical protein